MRILQYTADEIYARPEIVKRLRFLTNGGWGRHRIGSAFLLDLEDERPGTYFLVWENKQIIAWGLMCQRHGCYIADGGTFHQNDEYQLGCYVQAAHRRRGIASQIVQRAIWAAKAQNVKLVACPWNPRSRALYGSFGLEFRSWWQ